MDFLVDFIIQNWTLILMAVLSGGFLLFTGTQRSGAGISAAHAVQLINRERAVVVDVRPQSQFDGGHIVNSRNVPLEQLQADGATGLPTNKTLPLILICLTGYASKKASTILKAAGHTQVHILAGGIREWAKAEFPLEKSDVVLAKMKSK